MHEAENRTKKQSTRNKFKALFSGLSETVLQKSADLKNFACGNYKKFLNSAEKSGLPPDTLKEYSMLAASVLFGYLTGTAVLADGIRPFGIAAMSSFSDKKKALCTYAGCALSCLTYGSSALSSFIIYFMLYAARKVFTESTFSEKLHVRIAESAVISLAIGIIRTSTGFESPLQSCISVITLTALSCSFTYFFSVLFDYSIRNLQKISTLSICGYALMGVIVCSIKNISFLGIHISVAVTCIIILTYAAVGSFLHAGVVGFICGFFCSSPGHSVAFGVCGIIAALAVKKGVFHAVASFIASFFICSAYISGLTYSVTLIPSVLWGCVVFFPACGLISEAVRSTVRSPGIRNRQTVNLFGSDEHIRLSDACFSLSDIFSKLAEKQKYPSFSHTEIAVEKAFSKHCAECALSEMCFAKKSTDMDELKQTLFSVLSCRQAVNEDFGKNMNDKCIRLEKICTEINKIYRDIASKLAGDNRTSLLSAQYSGMARLILDTESRNNEAKSRNIALEKGISGALSDINIPFSCVTVSSGREKKTQIYGISPDKIHMSAKEFKNFIREKTGISITEPSYDISEKSEMTMSFERSPFISVEYAKAGAAKSGESISGDTVNFIRTDSGFFHAVICDGMGSGKEAAESSRLASLFLEKMLESGAKKSIILELLNSALMSRSGESFSTVDLFEADLLTGKCSFIKAGAAPTYIIRGSKLYKITSQTPPVGIISGFTAEITRFDVENGDIIVMVSDGIVPGGDDSARLAELIKKDIPREPSELAAYIINRTSEAGKATDDMSVAVIKISEYPQ